MPNGITGSISCNISWDKSTLFISAIAPNRERVEYQIWSDKCNILIDSGRLDIGVNGAENLFSTDYGLFYKNIVYNGILVNNVVYNLVVYSNDLSGNLIFWQYNFVFKPNIKDQYGDDPATVDDIKSTYIGNTMVEFHKATEENVTRNVSIGDLDHIVYKTKYDNAEDWKTPISEQTQYVWYFEDGKVEYRKEED